MAKSISQIHGNASMSMEKMPNLLTMVANRKDGIFFSISAKGEMVDNLASTGLPLSKKESEGADREKIIITEDNLKDFYVLTLEEKPSLNWLIGIIDLKATAENKAKGSDFSVHRVRNVDQNFLGDVAAKEGYDNIKYYTEHLKDSYGVLKSPNNNNFAYDNMGTCQMVALLHKGKEGMKFIGVCLYMLSAPRSAMANKSENSKRSFLGLTSGLAYNVGKVDEMKNPVVPLSPYYFVEQTFSEEISDTLREQIEGAWDMAVDHYVKWQNDIIKSFESFREKERSPNVKGVGDKPKSVVDREEEAVSILDEEDEWSNA